MIKTLKNIKRSTLFITATLAVSWVVIGIFFLFDGELASIPGTIVTVGYMFIPMLIALWIEKILYKNPIQQSLNISFRFNKWFVIAWLIAPILAFATLGLSLLFPEISYSADMAGMFERFKDMLTPEQMEEVKTQMDSLPIHPIWLTLVQGLVAGITINALAAFGEELGWRGFLLKEYSGLKFWKASLFIGFIWGLWHAPLILKGHNYPQNPEIGVFMMIVWCILLSPVFTYITIKSKSVIAASILHGTINATAGIAIMMVAGGGDLLAGVTGFSGFIVLAILLIILWVYDRYVSKEGIMSQRIDQFLFSESINDVE
jgi:membrane protease YdiL (CAAX protease family)